MLLMMYYQKKRQVEREHLIRTIGKEKKQLLKGKQANSTQHKKD